MTTKICTKCNVEKLLEEFYKKKDIQKPTSLCKICNNIKDDNYRKTLTGCLLGLLRGAKSHAKTRLANGRFDAGIFELTFDDIKNLWKNQDKKCYYSGIKMNYDKNEWKVSLERLDPKLGYIKNNIVLCCIEFNDKKQWRIEKVINMLHLLKQEFIFSQQDFKLIKKSQKNLKK